MSNVVFISAGILVAGAAAGLWLGWRRLSRGRLGGRRLPGVGSFNTDEDRLSALSSLALMQIGHSRRVAGAVAGSGPLHVFPYVFETGFEHRRQSHQWVVAVYQVEHGCGRATITSQEWLVASAWAPSCRELKVGNAEGSSRAASDRIMAIVEDADEWSRRLSDGLGRWFASQPLIRSWEIVPGLVVGHQPGPARPEVLEGLERAARELGELLKTEARSGLVLAR